MTSSLRVKYYSEGKVIYFVIHLIFFNSISGYGQPITNDSLIHVALAQKSANIEAASSQSITHFVMKNDDGTFGYAIFIDGNMTFHQPNIPAVSGNQGFAKVTHAEAVAKLAIKKIRDGESPPSVSVEEVEWIMNNVEK